MIFDYSNEHLAMGLCFNVVISNFRGSEELGLFTCTVLFKLLQEASWHQGKFWTWEPGCPGLRPSLEPY